MQISCEQRRQDQGDKSARAWTRGLMEGTPIRLRVLEPVISIFHPFRLSMPLLIFLVQKMRVGSVSLRTSRDCFQAVDLAGILIPYLSVDRSVQSPVPSPHGFSCIFLEIPRKQEDGTLTDNTGDSGSLTSPSFSLCLVLPQT